MPSLQSLPASDWAYQVGEFLTVTDLGRCEQAKLFRPIIFEGLWQQLATKTLIDLPLWGNSARSVVQQLFEDQLGGKAMLYELGLLRRALFLPRRWKPWITGDSFCSVTAQPLDPNAAPSALPYQACVALGAGSLRGQSHVLGMKMTAAGPMNDAVCLCIEAVEGGAGGREPRTISILFAPFTGQCFIQYGHGGPAVQSQLLTAVSTLHSLIAWVQVTPSGSIRFLRQFDGKDPEDAGFLAAESLPKFISEYYTSVDFWSANLDTTVKVSIEHSGPRFPGSMPVCEKCSREIDTDWELYGSGGWRIGYEL
eukprot:TRINITY_DN91137_c0_g1_i1.p1 TRINITY_DN91137_c0_g1~~TRINITY_DN91137_c0_g1_i1.p1  ORF type:complete len:329 (-),score=47.23 TRINITY_DN91137_c0_g1_i1:11-940(-)